MAGWYCRWARLRSGELRRNKANTDDSRGHLPERVCLLIRNRYLEIRIDESMLEIGIETNPEKENA